MNKPTTQEAAVQQAQSFYVWVSSGKDVDAMSVTRKQFRSLLDNGQEWAVVYMQRYNSVELLPTGLYYNNAGTVVIPHKNTKRYGTMSHRDLLTTLNCDESEGWKKVLAACKRIDEQVKERLG